MFSYIFRLLSEFLSAMFSAIYGRTMASGFADNFLTINVRYNKDVVSMTVLPTCTVAELKAMISEKLRDVGNKDLKLVIGGCLLNDESSLQDYDISQQTVINAFIQKHQQTSSVTDISILKRTQYYVYCKDCKSLSPGKLRVKCSTCKEGAFIADRGPDGWHDITDSQRITGKCQNQTCDGQMAEFYFKCSTPHPGNNISVGLQHVRPNSRQVECLACGEIQTPVLVYPCVMGHVTCLSCFKMYCEVMLNERRFIENDIYGYTLPCPAKCDNSLIKENHHFYLMGDELYRKYKDFGAEEYVLKSGGILCPGRNCGDAIYPETNDNQKLVRCPVCQYLFCVECRGDQHEGNCDVYLPQPVLTEVGSINEMRAERARWERQQSLLTINKTTKLCPNKDCKTPTEKDGGCSHMACSRCNLSWCWICEIEWNYDCQADHWFD